LERHLPAGENRFVPIGPHSWYLIRDALEVGLEPLQVYFKVDSRHRDICCGLADRQRESSQFLDNLFRTFEFCQSLSAKARVFADMVYTLH
jgi:hypothetical protein